MKAVRRLIGVALVGLSLGLPGMADSGRAGAAEWRGVAASHQEFAKNGLQNTSRFPKAHAVRSVSLFSTSQIPMPSSEPWRPSFATTLSRFGSSSGQTTGWDSVHGGH